MPFFRQNASLSHCFVGFESELKACSDRDSRISFSPFNFFEISSAVFSADFFVLTKTKACFPIFRVSRAILRTALSNWSLISIGFISKSKKGLFIKIVERLSELIYDYFISKVLLLIFLFLWLLLSKLHMRKEAKMELQKKMDFRKSILLLALRQ